MPLEKGRIVRSIAGRDKDLFLVVVGFDGDKVCLSDGRERPLERPKQKNVKHLRLTAGVIGENQLKTNRSIMHALRDYKSLVQHSHEGDE
ncbi:MAG: KOW domain-containing RNA-binding protein [Oscillospiraceae bacterium]|nr:KOW domain-containing RNA-binding protein [Oscillospiraceae bacterium]